MMRSRTRGTAAIRWLSWRTNGGGGLPSAVERCRHRGHRGQAQLGKRQASEVIDRLQGKGNGR